MHLLTRPQLNAAVAGPVHAAAKLGGKRGQRGGSSSWRLSQLHLPHPPPVAVRPKINTRLFKRTLPHFEMGSKRVSRCSRLIFDPLEIQPASFNNCLFACNEKNEKKGLCLSWMLIGTGTFHIDSFYQTPSELTVSKWGRIIHKAEGFCLFLSVIYTYV